MTTALPIPESEQNCIHHLVWRINKYGAKLSAQPCTFQAHPGLIPAPDIQLPDIPAGKHSWYTLHAPRMDKCSTCRDGGQWSPFSFCEEQGSLPVSSWLDFLGFLWAWSIPTYSHSATLLLLPRSPVNLCAQSVSSWPDWFSGECLTACNIIPT